MRKICENTGEQGSAKTRILAHFMQCTQNASKSKTDQRINMKNYKGTCRLFSREGMGNSAKEHLKSILFCNSIGFSFNFSSLCFIFANKKALNYNSAIIHICKC